MANGLGRRVEEFRLAPARSEALYERIEEDGESCGTFLVPRDASISSRVVD